MNPGLRVAILELFALCALPVVATSQTTTGSVDLTAANTHYGAGFSGTSFAVSPAFHVDAPNSVFDAAFTYSTLAGSWTTQGGARASLFTPRVSGLMGEIGGSADGSAHADGTQTGSFIGIGRIHALNEKGGAWLGGGGGRTWDGTIWRTLIQGEVGAWAALPAGTMSVVVNPSRLTGVGLGDTTKFTDAQASLSVFQDVTGLDLNLGFRTGSSLPIVGGDTKAWGSATGTYWFTKSLAVVVSGGTYPVNFGQGFPGGRFIAAGIRIGTIPTRGRQNAPATMQPAAMEPVVANPVESPPPNETAIAPPPSLGVGTLETTSAGGGQTRLSIRWPSASRLEIAGDFSNWDPVPLSRDANGSWTTTIRIPPGVHEINLRVDGGSWLVPPGLERKNDEFGGAVGLLIIGM